jgi:ribose transport system ATP-binding protein
VSGIDRVPVALTASPDPALRVSDLSKSYPGVRALDSVSFEIPRGTIHGLVGGNGSGKSTLIKVLAGVVQGDAGEIAVGTERYLAPRNSPAQARRAGLRFVHQEPTGFAALSVAENLAIGHGFEKRRTASISWRQQRRHARSVLERFGIHAKPEQLLGGLGPAMQAMVAIARALQDQDDVTTGVLVLDEPTAALPKAEVETLLGALKSYADAGQTIILVSHRLGEILDVTDSVTVLRDGAMVATTSTAELEHDQLVELIMGRPLDAMAPTTTSGAGEVLLECRGLSGHALRDATFSLHAGEVLGIAGLLGSGRSTLLRLLFGLISREDGEVRLEGRPVSYRHPWDAMCDGIAYVPESRSEAIFAGFSIEENLSMATLPSYWRGGMLRTRAIRSDARKLMARYTVKADSPRALASTLSGGNQQKVVLARWMARDPKLLLLDEPTQGVDVGARADIFELVRGAAARGAGVIVVSSDMEELSLVADRTLVLRRGEPLAEAA